VTTIAVTTIAAGRAIFILVVVAIASGCGADGPSRYSISGSVTFQGKPVPVGFIKFEPDTSKGNAGPGAGAPIKDGRYTVPSDKGVVGGHYRAIVDGFDGVPAIIDGEKSQDGKLSFSSRPVQMELPQKDTTWDIEVPVSTAGSK
jgi:hypothetical protein